MAGSRIHFAAGAYDPTLFIQLIVGGVFGAIFGSLIAPKVPSKHLRVALSCWLLCIGVDFCLHASKL
jgi:uncharacterized protein